jgi:hypothetical protein
VIASRSVEIADTDRLAHALTAPEPSIQRCWPHSAPFRHRQDLDRARLRQLFQHPDARAARAILHPLIRSRGQEMARWRGRTDSRRPAAARAGGRDASTVFSSSIVPKTSRFGASRREAR